MKPLAIRAIAIAGSERQRQRSITEMQPLQFKTERSDLDCSVIHAFDTEDSDIVLSFVTAIGSVTVKLPDELAAQLAGGVLKLLRAHLKSAQMTDRKPI
jgi:hypothetical protein